MLELGNDEGHLEVMHDHDGGNITRLGLRLLVHEAAPRGAPDRDDPDQGGPAAEVTLTAVDPKPDGTARTSGRPSTMASRSTSGTGASALKIGGKTFQSPLEGAAHDHK